jgi:hypothetical protein
MQGFGGRTVVEAVPNCFRVLPHGWTDGRRLRPFPTVLEFFRMDGWSSRLFPTVLEFFLMDGQTVVKAVPICSRV